MCDLAEYYIVVLKHLLLYVKLLRLIKIIYKPNSFIEKAIDL